MTDFDWARCGLVDPGDLTEARLQAHQAMQWLARSAYANLTPEPGDMQANLGWSRLYGALVTRTMASDVVVGLRLRDLTLFVERDGVASLALSLDGTGNAEAGGWLADELGRCGLAPGTFDAGLPYGDDLPSRVTGLAGDYPIADRYMQLAELSRWFANADAALRVVCDENSDLSPGPSEVRCWPHHFDIATLISLDDRGPEEPRSIGVGMSPGDGLVNEPYFYVSPWPTPDVAALPALAGVGKWYTDGFVGAVATGSEILRAEEQRDSTLEFLRGAVTACRSVLSSFP